MKGNWSRLTVYATNTNRFSLAAHDRDKMDHKQGPYYHPGSANAPQQQHMMASVVSSAPHAPQHRRYTDSIVPPPSSDLNDNKHNHVSPHLQNISEYGNFQGLGVDLPAGFSPGFAFSPLPQGNFDPALFGMSAENSTGNNASTNPPPAATNGNNVIMGYDSSMHNQAAATPGGLSQSSSHNNEEKDPFLTLLEQLAENEHSRGGPSDLDYYLGGQEG